MKMRRIGSVPSFTQEQIGYAYKNESNVLFLRCKRCGQEHRLAFDTEEMAVHFLHRWSEEQGGALMACVFCDYRQK